MSGDLAASALAKNSLTEAIAASCVVLGILFHAFLDVILSIALLDAISAFADTSVEVRCLMQSLLLHPVSGY